MTTKPLPYLLRIAAASQHLRPAPTRTSTALAEAAGLDHADVLSLIDEHVGAKFSPVTFDVCDGQRVAHLTEKQAVFLALLLPDTPATARFKMAFIKEFFSMRREATASAAVLT